MEISNFTEVDDRYPRLTTDYYVRKYYGIRRFNENETCERGYFYPTQTETKSSREMVPVKYSKPIYCDYPVIFGTIDPIVASYWQINRP